jgi:hypothetical protein
VNGDKFADVVELVKHFYRSRLLQQICMGCALAAQVAPTDT